MQAIFVFFLALFAFATEGFGLRNKSLLPRSIQDTQPEVTRSEVVVNQVYITFTTATKTIVTSCQDGDSVKVEQSLSTVQVSVTQLTSVVESFDGHHAIAHQNTVVEIFSSYISIVNAISQYKNGTEKYQTTLQQINESFRSINAVYLKVGINLGQNIKDNANFNKDSFDKLNLSSPFGDEKQDSTPDDEDPEDESQKQSDSAPVDD